MNRFVLPCLAIICMGLIGIVGWLWVDEDGELKNVKWSTPQAVRPDIYSKITRLGAPDPIASVHFLSTTERPLFSRTRRPPLPPPPPPPPPVPVAPDIFSGAVLKGIANYQGGGAVIMDISGRSRRIKIGDSFEGWRLLKIEGAVAVFTSGNSQRVIQLTKQAAVKAGSSSAISMSGGNLVPVPLPPNISSSPTSAPVTDSAGGALPAKKSRFGP